MAVPNRKCSTSLIGMVLPERAGSTPLEEWYYNVMTVPDCEGTTILKGWCQNVKVFIRLLWQNLILMVIPH